MDLYQRMHRHRDRHAAVGINDNFTTSQTAVTHGPPITKRPVGLMKNLVAEVTIQRAELA